MPRAPSVLDRAASGDREAALRVVLEDLSERAARVSGRDWRIQGTERAQETVGTLGGGAAAPSPGRIAERLRVPERTLRHVVREHVGFSLATWVRIGRVHRAVEFGTASGHRLSRVAQAAGYYDHPHMVRDFRVLLGETPTEFFARARTNSAAEPCRSVQDAPGRIV